MDNGWAVVIVVLVIAMAVGPVMLMQPSGRQRRLAKLRTAALGEGIRVSVSAWPSKAGDCPIGAMRYGLPYGSDEREATKVLLVRKNYQHELHLAGVWQKFPDNAQVNQKTLQLVQDNPLAECIYSFGFDGGSAFVDWSEGNSADLAMIKQVLVGLRGCVE